MSSTLATAKQSRKFDPSNIKVTADTAWWGFTLHLNEDATQALETFDDVLAKVLKYALQEIPELDAIADLIIGYIKARNFIIKAEDQGTGVKLVSPWPMPTLLVPLPDPTHIDDSQLRWTTTDGQNGWVAEQKMNSAFSETGPALAVFQEKLHCVYKGGGDNNHIYWMVFDGTWSDPQLIPNVYTTDTPALAVSPDNSRLCCVYKGSGNDHLYWMYFDGNDWISSGDPIPSADSQSGPALTLFQNKLCCIYRGGGSNNNIYHMESSDGIHWNASGYNRIPNVETQSGPALAVLNNNLLCSVYRGSGNNHLYWMTSFNGTDWNTGNTPIPSADSKSGPSLANFQGLLYCLYRGNNDNEHIYHMESPDGINWNASGYNVIPNVNSYYQPALAVYRHPLGTRDQLLCVHRGIKN
jgi:hypothetical protein